MTEKKIEAYIDGAADRFETCVEKTADKFEEVVTYKWDSDGKVRKAVRTMSVATDIGAIASGGYLALRGYKRAATWCIGLGVVGLIAEIITHKTSKR